MYYFRGGLIMVIWFLDCGNGCVTRVKLSAEREREMEDTEDLLDFIQKYEEEWGVDSNSASWMVSENEEVYDVDF